MTLAFIKQNVLWQYAILELQIVRLGLRLVTSLNHCSQWGQLFAHILW